jgi:tetratricopeptide (TPR) repeat protein
MIGVGNDIGRVVGPSGRCRIKNPAYHFVVALICAAAVWALWMPTARATDAADVAKYIRQLGDDDYHKREAASKWLWDHGEDALDALFKAAKDRDLEISARAERILGALRLGVTDSTPENIAAMLTTIHNTAGRKRRRALRNFPIDDAKASSGLKWQYRFTTDPEDRQAIVSALNVGRVGVEQFLIDCYRLEKNPATLHVILRLLGRRARPLIVPLLADDKADKVARLLAQAMGKSRNLMYDWVALTALIGKLDEAISEYKKKARTGGEFARQTLVRLKRARGDVPARRPARRNRSTRTNLPQWRKKLARLRQIEKETSKQKRLPETWHYVKVALYCRLLGDEDGRREAVGRIRSTFKPGWDASDMRSWINALVAIDAVDAAVEELLRHHLIRPAHQLLSQLGRYTDADAALRKSADDRAAISAFPLYAVHGLLKLGDKKRAGRVAEQVMELTTAKEAQIVAKLAVLDEKKAAAQRSELMLRRRRLTTTQILLVAALHKSGRANLSRRHAERLVESVKSGLSPAEWNVEYLINVLHEMGRPDMIRTLLHDVSKGRVNTRLLAKYAARAGERDFAFGLVPKLLGGYLARAGKSGRSRFVECGLWTDGVHAALFPEKQDASGLVIFSLLERQESMTTEATARAWRRTVKAADGTGPFLALIKEVEARLADWPAASRARQVDQLIAACRQMGEEERSWQVEERALAVAATADLAMRVGDRLRAAKRWAEAAAAYDRAWQIGLGAPALFLRGWTLTQLGREAEGQRLMSRASLVPLSDARGRVALARAMDDAGMHQEAFAQRRLITRISPGGYDRYPDGLTVAELTTEDCASAEEGGVSAIATANGWFSNAFAAAELPPLARIREMMADGRADRAVKALRQRLHTFPANEIIAKVFVPLLDKLGRTKEADEIFAIVFDALNERLRRSPDDRGARRTLARICAVCRRRLDAALAHALKASEGRAPNCAALDTLAEVHFRRGEFAKARKMALRAFDVEPDYRYMHRRLLYFLRPDAKLKKDLGPRPPSVGMQ